MRVPIRKPGKFTHQKADHNLTQAKLDELKEKLKRVKASHKPAAEELARLRELGDLSENAAYQIAKGKLRGINQRITDLTNQINYAVVIKPANSGVVQLGNTVTVKINGEEKEYLILGSNEADPGRNIISHNSPIGAALMGRRKGDEIEVEQRKNIIKFKIIKII
ncbi:MAG: transcription elongation factor GreA [Parcubacteria group bacterium]|jgi:transcription elongation factor GreA|nr:transcription elongation factor GreA [Parcubacteria group bacterium]|tara:strand:+ start:1847 stop:2341 length:495 start_codon:yes stop_codon:yes gene_type:complete